MEKDDEIIEAEILSDTIIKSEGEDEAKRPESDHSDAIRRLGFWASLLLRVGRVGLTLFTIAGFAFSILYQNNPSQTFLILMIVGWSLAALCCFALLLGLILERVKRKVMSKDPNYEDYLL